MKDLLDIVESLESSLEVEVSTQQTYGRVLLAQLYKLKTLMNSYNVVSNRKHYEEYLQKSKEQDIETVLSYVNTLADYERERIFKHVATLLEWWFGQYIAQADKCGILTPSEVIEVKAVMEILNPVWYFGSDSIQSFYKSIVELLNRYMSSSNQFISASRFDLLSIPLLSLEL